ncbi:MAG TPA: hypothetical protein VGW80_01095 [Solirubrobacterales bacterium]|jgi:hypothetical protein|nr:hypothetical protein [Solirubrobacterales bacterium]
MSTLATDRFTRAIGAAIGLVLVAALIVAARPAGGHGGVLPASLRFTATLDGAVAVEPAAPKPLLASGPMRPGSHARGELTLRNQTGETLAVRLRAKASSTALDGTARVRIVSQGATLADGTLQALRQGTAEAVRLQPGGAARVRVIVWIPAEVETGYEGRNVAVALEPVEEAQP